MLLLGVFAQNNNKTTVSRKMRIKNIAVTFNISNARIYNIEVAKSSCLNIMPSRDEGASLQPFTNHFCDAQDRCNHLARTGECLFKVDAAMRPKRIAATAPAEIENSPGD